MSSDDLGLLYIATDYHDAMPLRIRDYLNHRGITDPVIDLHLLGWNGDRITIPIFKREGGIAFFKLAKDPKDTTSGPKMLTPAGQTPELYGWERVRVKPCEIVICEGEFDRLALERHGFGAVTSTGGAGVFRSEWAEAIKEIPDVYLCFDRDEAGRNGALSIARMIPHARIVELPEEVGEGGDVTDFLSVVRISSLFALAPEYPRLPASGKSSYVYSAGPLARPQQPGGYPENRRANTPIPGTYRAARNTDRYSWSRSSSMSGSIPVSGSGAAAAIGGAREGRPRHSRIARIAAGPSGRIHFAFRSFRSAPSRELSTTMWRLGWPLLAGCGVSPGRIAGFHRGLAS